MGTRPKDTEKPTLWWGRREADVARLEALVPQQGEVTAHGGNNVALEIFRQFSNSYYDLFNNGGGNWSNRGHGYRNAAKLYGFPVRGVRQLRQAIDWRRDHYDEELEALGDAVIDGALKEQFDEAPEPQQRQAELSQ